ncbi:MAG: hypothetical protein GY862_26820 [Gammaproteobacteria bacterium]|nr:hypothetical protein [Gammaproteobacteria bacterium]
METTVVSEQKVFAEAMDILFRQLAPEKMARFITIWQKGGGDYLNIKEQLFKHETVDTLYDKVIEFQKKP